MMNILSPIKQEDLRANFYNIVKGSAEDASVSSEMISQEEAREIPPEGTVLDLYTTNLLYKLKKGK